jgi:hypothetical protein
MTTLIVSSLDPSNSEQLKDLPPEADRWVNETCLVGIDKGSFPDKIGLVGLDELGLLEELPDEEERWDDNLHSVVGPESLHVPRLVGWVAVKDSNDHHPDESDICASGLQPGIVGELTAVKVLGFAGTVEKDISDANSDVVN